MHSTGEAASACPSTTASDAGSHLFSSEQHAPLLPPQLETIMFGPAQTATRRLYGTVS
jgi:hypothetical protein